MSRRKLPRVLRTLGTQVSRPPSTQTDQKYQSSTTVCLTPVATLANPTFITLQTVKGVSAQGVDGKDRWKNSCLVAHTMKLPSGLVCLTTYIQTSPTPTTQTV